jgi:hypothetical protein
MATEEFRSLHGSARGARGPAAGAAASFFTVTRARARDAAAAAGRKAGNVPSVRVCPRTMIVRKPPEKPARSPKSAAKPAPPAPKRAAHRPPYVPADKDRLTVKVMVAGGIEQDKIAAVIGVSRPTLRKYFRREIDVGAAEVGARVVASLIQMATTGKNVHAAKWYTQARLGWSERLIVADGDANVDPTTLSDAELEAAIARLRRSPAVRRAEKAAGNVH